MARIIAVVNQKGGVGKTTSTVNISATLHELGQRVLLCDFDPQANATSGMGVDKNTASPNIYDVLVNGAEPVIKHDQVRRQVYVMEEAHKQNPLPRKY